MSKATHNDQGWEVLAQPTGEVLTAEAHSPGLLLGLLGVPRGFEARDAEGWLYDVAGVSHESSAGRPSRRPIPSILDHAITGLLFSHGELWEQEGAPSPCSYAFIEGRGEIGFGWVGDAKVSVWVDGEPREAGFITLRDSRGRKGRAWSIPSYHNVQVRISWLSSAEDPTAGGAEVEASWIADGRAAPGYHPVPVHGEMAAVFAAEVPAVETESIPAMAPDMTPAIATEVVLEAIPELREPIPLIVEAQAPVAEVAERPRRGFGAWLRRVFGWLPLVRKDEDEVDEDEVWRVAAEESVDLVATGTDDAIGFATGVAPAPGVTLQLAEHTPPGYRSQRPEPWGPAGESYAPDASPTPPSHGEPTLYEPSFAAAPAYEGDEPQSVPQSADDVQDVQDVQGERGEPSLSALPGEEWGVADDPHAIDLPSLEPAARLARIEESLREDRGLELVGVTPEEPEVESRPVSNRIAESFPTIEHAGLELVRTPSYDEDAYPRAAEAPASVEGPAGVPADVPADMDYAPQASAGALPSSWSVIAPQHPAWPTPQELARSRRSPLGVHAWIWAALVAVLFAGGWLVGGIQDDGHPRDAAHRGALASLLHSIGLGGPRYRVEVTSRPPGAWITVDGEGLSLRTPATIEAKPGRHMIELSFADHGSASFPVQGRKGEQVPLDAALWGALDIMSPDEIGVIGVAVDGVPRGLAPMRVDSLAPGVHEVRFSAPGLEPWGQTVEIRVRQTHEMLSRAVQSPSTGVLDVQASVTDETGSQPLKGAQVYIDGESRGVTPLVLDLPRGPHSVRLSYKGQEAPIQVIDLPGGNQRFAVFEMGLDNDAPRLTVDLPARIPRDRPAIVSATVVGVTPAEVREMWLHVQMPEGAWRRYAMTMLKASGGAAGVVTFPTAAFDGRGRARYYVSAQSGQGDETFTELRTIQLEGPPAP
jgi:hypothetical protein